MIKTTESHLNSLKGEIEHQEVLDLAGNIYGILSLISTNYSSDAIVDLIPIMSTVLNRLDATLTVINDLSNNLRESHDEISQLRKTLDMEKQSRKTQLEVSLSYEEETGTELSLMKNSLNVMKDSVKKMTNELKSKDHIIAILTEDCVELNQRLEEGNYKPKADSFRFPKTTARANCLDITTPEVESYNRFNLLSMNESVQEPPTVLSVRADVHAEDASPPLQPKTSFSHSRSKFKSRGRITVLADSHGKQMYHALSKNGPEFSTFVQSKSGAKLKQVLRYGHEMINNYTSDDYCIVMGGTNDIGPCEPSQFTLHQGISELLSWKTRVNIIVMSIPYRYDQPKLNDNIFFANMCLRNKIKSCTGHLNIRFLDINVHLERKHYTRHGLHFNRSGKLFISKLIIEHIQHDTESTTKQTSHRTTSKVQAQRTIRPTCHSSPDIKRHPCSSPNASILSCDVITNSPSPSVPRCLSARNFPPLPASPSITCTQNEESSCELDQSQQCFLTVVSNLGDVK